MRRALLVALSGLTVVATTTGGILPASASPCTPATEFAGITLETGCMEEIIDVCDAYQNDQMHRLPAHQHDAVCEA